MSGRTALHVLFTKNTVILSSADDALEKKITGSGVFGNSWEKDLGAILVFLFLILFTIYIYHKYIYQR